MASEDRALPTSIVGSSVPRPATSLSQRFTNAAEPSTSFLAASGEFHRSSKSLPRDESQTCIAQMDVDNESHGIMDPVSFEFDRSTGYLPITDSGPWPVASGGHHAAGAPETSCNSLGSFLKVVSSERLNRMPHRASKWDRIIRLLEGRRWPFLTRSFTANSPRSRNPGFGLHDFL